MSWFEPMTIEEIRQELMERGDSAGFEYDFARRLQEHYGISNMDAGNMIRIEAEEQLATKRYKGRRNQWGIAVRNACGAILDWIEHAEEFRVTLGNARSLAEFVASHRRACAWAVFIGLKNKGQ